jgi:hypothetical protein
MNTQSTSILQYEYTGLRRIISGGQVGADIGALVAARAAGVSTGGWAPRGWQTVDGPRPELAEFGLKEHFRQEYKYRTEKNVEESDGTLIVASDMRSPGTDLTISTCSLLEKPFYCVRPSRVAEEIPLIVSWIISSRIENLNVAGNRDTGSSTLHHAATFDAVTAIIQLLNEKKLLNRGA